MWLNTNREELCGNCDEIWDSVQRGYLFITIKIILKMTLYRHLSSLQAQHMLKEESVPCYGVVHCCPSTKQSS